MLSEPPCCTDDRLGKGKREDGEAEIGKGNAGGKRKLTEAGESKAKGGKGNGKQGGGKVKGRSQGEEPETGGGKEKES